MRHTSEKKAEVPSKLTGVPKVEDSADSLAMETTHSLAIATNRIQFILDNMLGNGTSEADGEPKSSRPHLMGLMYINRNQAADLVEKITQLEKLILG